MTVPKFHKYTRLLSAILMMLSVVVAITFIIFIIMLIFNRESLVVSKPKLALTLISAGKQDLPKKVEMMAGIIILLPLMNIYSYVYYKGSRFFLRLTSGETPFSKENVQLIKRIGMLLIRVSLFTPIIYSAVASFLMPTGYYVSLGVEMDLVIGLLIYCMAEVINYGLELQNFSEDVV